MHINTEDSEEIRLLKENHQSKYFELSNLSNDQQKLIEDISLKLTKQNYLLFILHKKGFPVEDLYNNKIKNISDQFFQELTDI